MEYLYSLLPLAALLFFIFKLDLSSITQIQVTQTTWPVEDGFLKLEHGGSKPGRGRTCIMIPVDFLSKNVLYLDQNKVLIGKHQLVFPSDSTAESFTAEVQELVMSHSNKLISEKLSGDALGDIRDR